MLLFIIFPTTLYKNIELIKSLNIDKIIIIEDDIYFTKFKFHKQKLVLHRASMKYYYKYLKEHFNNIEYIDFIDNKKFYNSIKKYEIHCYDPIDNELLNKIKKNTKKDINIYDNLCFMETYDDLLDYKNKNTNNKFRHDDFYKWNRNRLNIFMDENNKPLYGKYSFDTENRKNFNKNYTEPKLLPNKYFDDAKYINEAIKYVNDNFKNNFGLINDVYIYPITHLQAEKLLNHFLNNKINTFGEYQDATSENIIVGSHSFLSSSLNIGLITVEECVNKTISSFEKLNSNNKKKLYNNYEGFIRQIIGWRSYTRFMYEFYEKKMMSMNFFKHTKKINKNWYDGTTGIYPIDFLINKVNKYAYLHHIERLMYIGNWMLLSQIHPKQVYDWFMIVSIDSYAWVMISNVFGMSQHSLNNNSLSMMTRPYFSSTNYIKNMSDFINKSNNKEWIETWNNLYYYFIYKNKKYLQSNYSIARQVIHWNNKTDNEKKDIIKFSINYLK